MKNLQNKEDLDIVKEEKINSFLKSIPLLDTMEWSKSYSIVYEFCNLEIKISNSILKKIVQIKNKQLVDVFLKEYILFDNKDKEFLEKFINKKLNNKNKEFVSDLIYIANDLNLNLNYENLLSLVKLNAGDPDYSVLAAIEYFSNNLKFNFVKKLVETLNFVVNNNTYYQTEQIIASLTLYRITNKSNYLNFIQELIDFDNGNLKYLKNVLQSEIFDDKYFNTSDFYKKVKIKD